MQFATLQDHLECSKLTGIDCAADLGFDGIELVIPDGMHEVGPHGMRLRASGYDVDGDSIWNSTDRDELREHAATRGVTLTSLCPSFLNMRAGLTAADAVERNKVSGYIESLIEAGGDLGVDTILLPFFAEAEINTDEQRRRVGDELQSLAVAADRVDLTLAVESTLSAADHLSLLDAIDHPAVGIYYDVGNAAWYGYDPAEELQTLGEHVTQIHFKDGTEGSADTRLGAGRVDFTAVAAAIRTIDYDNWIVLETSYDSDPIASMRDNLSFVRELFE